MDSSDIRRRILSEEYADILAVLNLREQDVVREFEPYGAQPLGGQFAMFHVPLSELPANLLNAFGYSYLPKLYTTLDTTSLELSGILRLHTLPSYPLTGQDVLIGFLDTGISYQAPVFRNRDGSTRILGIWDQTIQDGAVSFLNYGTVYTEAQINEALSSPDPFALVPSTDENGHGTFLASVACGGTALQDQFSGAAPGSRIAMVKLKTAKEYLQRFFLVDGSAPVFQETDLMAGIRFLQELAARNRLPLVLCIGLGTNQGDHAGGTPLSSVLNEYSRKAGFYPVIAGGNEAGRSHHFYGKLESEGDTALAEILVSPETSGFSMELWAQAPEVYSVSVTSPMGETIPDIPARLRQQFTYRFTLEQTVLSIHYELVEAQSGSQLILLRFDRPSGGVWQIRVTNRVFLNGAFHIWLPVTGFLPEGTVFLAPNPDTTLTGPSDAAGGITVSTYNAYDGSLYIHSSRGYTRAGGLKPDLAAPGVDVTGVTAGFGPDGGFRYTLSTGSSIAAAMTSGAVALLVDWEQKRIPMVPTAAEVRNLLVRGAKRSPDLAYPNQAWGYGALDLYGIFESIR